MYLRFLLLGLGYRLSLDEQVVVLSTLISKFKISYPGTPVRMLPLGSNPLLEVGEVQLQFIPRN